jgi:16S rRNA A1518/A1519 N6-dimethyltransferase RsmA/KsgA/DIM1 with predicted DNA glycosylase/AP lyase activity
MERKAFRPKKRFGQCFLYDPAIAGKILACVDIEPGQAVIELGAGKGILTKPLAQRGVRLMALEIDPELCAELERATREAQDSPEGDVEILNVDFTRISLTGLLASRGLESCVLIGNIPYNLTRDVLFSFLVDEVEMLDAAYLMTQREVGERIVSPPGSRVYGITSSSPRRWSNLAGLSEMFFSSDARRSTTRFDHRMACPDGSSGRWSESAGSISTNDRRPCPKRSS